VAQFDRVYYGNDVDINLAKQSGLQGRFVDISKYGEDSKYKDLLHAYKTGANPILLGGAGAKGGINDSLYNQLKGSGADIQRIGGKDRYEVQNNLRSYAGNLDKEKSIYDSQNSVNSIYDQQKKAQMEQLKAQRDKAIGGINSQKQALTPQFQAQRNQSDAVNAQNVQRLRELMAANGLTASGENVTAQVAQNNQRQQSLGNINMQEQQQIGALDQRIADFNNPSEENAMVAALEAERSKSLLDAKNRAETEAYQRSRDVVADSRYEQERLRREYEYRNLSEAEKRQYEWLKQQHGDQMAWNYLDSKMQSEATKSASQAQIEALLGANFTNGAEGLGSLSQKYESSGNPGAIGNNSGDIGGKSYGTYQLATNMGTPQKFVSYLAKISPDMARYFSGKKPGTGSFDSAWKTLATAKPKEFAAAQHQFIKASYFDPVVKSNPWISKYPKAVQDAVWSTAVQHGVGGANSILSRVVKVGMTPQAVINAIYNERSAGGGMKYFSKSSSSVRNGVLNRFARERQDALNMLG
jgi:hypothetical protein